MNALPMTLGAGLARASQFAFYAMTMATAILAIREFWPRLLRREIWTKEQILLVVLLSLPRAALVIIMPLNGNEMGGDAWLYRDVALDFPSSILHLPAGYPYLLGLGLRLLSGHYHVDAYAILFLQHLSGVLTALLLFRWVRTYSRFQAWFAALGWGWFFHAIASEHLTRPEFFVTFALFVTVWLLTRQGENNQPGGGRSFPVFWIGVAFGWAVLARGNTVSVLAALVGYLFCTRKRREGKWVGASLKITGLATLVVVSYTVLNHFPATGSLVLYTGPGSHLYELGVLTREKMTLDGNPHARKLLDIHHDVGAYLRHLDATGKNLAKLRPFPNDAFRRASSPEAEREREAFARFRKTVDDSGLAAYRDLTRIEEFYPNVEDELRAYFEQEAPRYYVGFLEIQSLLFGVSLHAVRQDPWWYFLNVIRCLPAVFFLTPHPIQAFLELRQPLHFNAGQPLPLGFLVGERVAARGLVWPPGVDLFLRYGRLWGLLMLIVAMLFPLAVLWTSVRFVLNRSQVPQPVLMGLAVVASYLAVLASVAGSGRYYLPIYPFVFQILAFSVQDAAAALGRRVGPGGKPTLAPNADSSESSNPP